ncbi:sodium:solute symporter family protein [Microlunatus panaciterrae]|uniref:SSS family solute:Na+ symporter n=1 Tax=Microlunatus panaciterrae TaxID=400768 RepID=A0ABS2RJ98_9ACTN|nr:sodium:solute symporter family protein [Microlunatus panaciterrae]MBM7798642.1 SSS family solute:Na+ symporter [Microlunatus panaciterrae]
MTQLDVNPMDFVILGIYFALVVAIGFLARRAIATSEDFLLSGRSLPAWVTGLAFISANLGAIEILGMAANGAKYGISTVHFYWIGAVPAMVFLGLVMMPFYYGSRVRSVPEYLLRRFNPATHLVNALSFALAAVLTAGVNLYALALVIKALLGWPTWASILIAAGFVLAYITLGGLSGAIYNEVLQFFVILAGLIPLVIIGLKDVGGWSGLKERVSSKSALGADAFSTWAGTGVGHWTNPLGDWIGIVMGLGFVLSFGYWTTNFAEVQRALSAKNLSAAERTPLIGAFPKIFIPAVTIIPGLIAIAILPKFGQKGSGTDYNDAIPILMNHYLPNGALGLALAGLLAAFMAGMAANVSSFNTVFTYDIWQSYIRKNFPDHYYLNVGRIVTVVGIMIGVGTAFIASGYSNIMDYIQLLFSFFNAPLFATFIIAMFWKRCSPWAGFAGLIAGTAGAGIFHLIGPNIAYFHAGQTMSGEPNAQMINFFGAITAFVADAVVTVIVTLVTPPKPVAQLAGLVYGVPDPNAGDPHEGYVRRWWESPKLLGFTALGIVLVLSIIFA